jgi:signal transduction histidine kinase
LTTAKSPQNPLIAPVSLPKSVQTVGVALGIALLTLGLAQSIGVAELELMTQIAPALAENGIAVDPNRLFQNTAGEARLLQFAVLFGISWTLIALTMSQRFLKTTSARVVVSLQLYLLASAAQVFVLPHFNVLPLFATSAVATVLSCAMGMIMGQRSQQNKVLESQYYELKIRNKELAEANLALVERDEVERRILAADLHDQVLNDLKKILENFTLFEKEPDNKATSNAIRSDFNSTMNHIREIMDDLSPIMLQNFGLRAAVEDCLEKGKERSNYAIEFACEVEDDVLDKLTLVQQSLLYRLVQESLTNISKHAKATRVSITIAVVKSNLAISIEDNGKGIDYEKISHQSRGLRYMKLRADLIDATVEWKPGRDGKGTKVVISFPLPNE